MPTPHERALLLLEERGVVGLLSQDAWWAQDDGRLVELAELRDDELERLETYLVRNAFRFASETIVLDLDERPDGLPHGEDIAYEMTGAHMLDLTAEEWLETTALMRAVRRRRARGGGR